MLRCLLCHQFVCFSRVTSQGSQGCPPRAGCRQDEGWRSLNNIARWLAPSKMSAGWRSLNNIARWLAPSKMSARSPSMIRPKGVQNVISSAFVCVFVFSRLLVTRFPVLDLAVVATPRIFFADVVWRGWLLLFGACASVQAVVVRGPLSGVQPGGSRRRTTSAKRCAASSTSSTIFAA